MTDVTPDDAAVDAVDVAAELTSADTDTTSFDILVDGISDGLGSVPCPPEGYLTDQTANGLDGKPCNPQDGYECGFFLECQCTNICTCHSFEPFWNCKYYCDESPGCIADGG